MTIAAILDLDTALATFRQTAQPLLQPTEMSQWDGSYLQAQEQQIRQAALELAGHCIAMLLQKLSQDLSAQEQANQRTASSRGFGAQSQGKQQVSITTLGNVEVKLHSRYVLTRCPRSSCGQRRQRQAGQRGKSKGQGFYPLLRWLALEEKVTPLVWSTTAAAGMLSNSFAMARIQLQQWGINLSQQRIERLTYRFGQIGVELTEQWLQQLEQGQLSIGESLRGQRVGLHVDGGRTRIRRAKRGRQPQQGRRGYYGDWCEPKLLTLYAIDEQGKRINTIALPVTNDGTFGDVEQFMALLEVYLVKLGIVHAAQVLIVADGALWIWQRLPSLLQRLGLPKERVIELIDFYHATQHLLQFAEEAFANKSVQRQWFKRARSQLKHKPFSLLLAKMYEQVEQQQSKSKQKKLKAHLAYFSAQPQRFAYAQVRAMKLPIGSGAIESLIRQVVNLRLKGTGKFWLANHAEVVLHGRCQWAAGQWQQFSQSVLRAALDSKPLPILTPASPQLVPA